MRQKRNGGDVAFDSCWNGGDDRAVFGEPNIAGAELSQLVNQHALEIELDRGAWMSRRRFVGLGIDLHIAKQAILQVGEVPIRHSATPFPTSKVSYRSS
jgi:hypothetical protein